MYYLWNFLNQRNTDASQALGLRLVFTERALQALSSPRLHANPAHFLFAVQNDDITPLNIPVAFFSPHHTLQCNSAAKD